MEIELKLLATPDALAKIRRHPAVQALQQGKARTQALHTLYYDTPDRDLARAGIALRVRRAGKQWIQTLKAGGGAAAGLHERVEIEWPLRTAALDAGKLAETVYADFFKPACLKALRPAFETEFRRIAIPIRFEEGSEAELALDEGLVRAGTRSAPLCEAEIELQQGDPQRLFELALKLSESLPLRLGHISKAQRGDLLARGAALSPQQARTAPLDPSLSAIEALKRILLNCMRQMQANEEGALAGDDPEFLHQFRVGLRRLRSALDLLKDLGDCAELKALRREFKDLSQALNAARDWDVLCLESLPQLQGLMRSDARLEALAARCADLRQHPLNRARDAIASTRTTRALLRLGATCAHPVLGLDATQTSDTGVKAWASDFLDRRDRRLRKSGAKLSELAPSERHELRIRVKKLRYAAEFFAPLYPNAGPYAQALRLLQKQLGVLNDASVSETLVAPLAASGETAVACGMLHGWNAMRVNEALRRYPRLWRKFKDANKFWKSDA